MITLPIRHRGLTKTEEDIVKDIVEGYEVGLSEMDDSAFECIINGEYTHNQYLDLFCLDLDFERYKDTPAFNKMIESTKLSLMVKLQLRILDITRKNPQVVLSLQEQIDKNNFKDEYLTNERELELAYVQSLEIALSGTTSDVTLPIKIRMIHPFEGNRFACGLIYNTNNNQFYLWNKQHRIWEIVRQSAETYRLQEACNHIIGACEYSIHTTNIALQEAKKTDSQTEKSQAEVTLKKLRSLISKLKTASFKKNLWADLKIQTAQSLFGQMDIVSPMIPLNNGYNYDIFTGNSILRSFSDNNKYTHTINAHIDDSIKTIIPNEDSSEDHHFVFNFFKQLCCQDIELTVYLISMLGIYISGNVFDKSLMLIVGTGSNGKSVLHRIYGHLLSESYTTIDTALAFLTGNGRASSSHTASIVKLLEKRVGLICEAEKQSRGLNITLIKQITGGDPVSYRACGAPKEEQAAIPIHIIMFANPGDIPYMNPIDKALRERVKYIPFKAEFTKNESLVNNDKHVYLADYLIEDRLKEPGNLDIFFTMMAIGAQTYRSNNNYIPEPQVVIDSTNKFFTKKYELSSYSDFLNDCCIIDEGNKDCYVHPIDLHDAYRIYSDNNGQTYDNSQIFKRSMDKIFPNKCQKPPNNTNHYIGLSLKRIQPINSRPIVTMSVIDLINQSK